MLTGAVAACLRQPAGRTPAHIGRTTWYPRWGRPVRTPGPHRFRHTCAHECSNSRCVAHRDGHLSRRQRLRVRQGSRSVDHRLRSRRMSGLAPRRPSKHSWDNRAIHHPADRDPRSGLCAAAGDRHGLLQKRGWWNYEEHCRPAVDQSAAGASSSRGGERRCGAGE